MFSLLGKHFHHPRHHCDAYRGGMEGCKSGPSFAASYSVARRLFGAGGVFAQRGVRGRSLAHGGGRNKVHTVRLAAVATWCVVPYRANV